MSSFLKDRQWKQSPAEGIVEWAYFRAGKGWNVRESAESGKRGLSRVRRRGGDVRGGLASALRMFPVYFTILPGTSLDQGDLYHHPWPHGVHSIAGHGHYQVIRGSCCCERRLHNSGTQSNLGDEGVVFKWLNWALERWEKNKWAGLLCLLSLLINN